MQGLKPLPPKEKATPRTSLKAGHYKNRNSPRADGKPTLPRAPEDAGLKTGCYKTTRERG